MELEIEKKKESDDKLNKESSDKTPDKLTYQRSFARSQLEENLYMYLGLNQNNKGKMSEQLKLLTSDADESSKLGINEDDNLFRIARVMKNDFIKFNIDLSAISPDNLNTMDCFFPIYEKLFVTSGEYIKFPSLYEDFKLFFRMFSYFPDIFGFISPYFIGLFFFDISPVADNKYWNFEIESYFNLATDIMNKSNNTPVVYMITMALLLSRSPEISQRNNESLNVISDLSDSTSPPPVIDTEDKESESEKIDTSMDRMDSLTVSDEPGKKSEPLFPGSGDSSNTMSSGSDIAEESLKNVRDFPPLEPGPPPLDGPSPLDGPPPLDGPSPLEPRPSSIKQSITSEISPPNPDLKQTGGELSKPRINPDNFKYLYRNQRLMINVCEIMGYVYAACSIYDKSEMKTDIEELINYLIDKMEMGENKHFNFLKQLSNDNNFKMAIKNNGELSGKIEKMYVLNSKAEINESRIGDKQMTLVGEQKCKQANKKLDDLIERGGSFKAKEALLLAFCDNAMQAIIGKSD